MIRVLSVSLLAVGVCLGQQGFPLKQGDWEGSTKMPGAPEPMVNHFCFTDAEWIKAMTQNSVCKIDQLKMSPTGASYAMDCPMKALQMKGTVELKFDGKEHMTGTGKMTATSRRGTNEVVTVTEYRWKSSQCNADAVNLRKKNEK